MYRVWVPTIVLQILFTEGPVIIFNVLFVTGVRDSRGHTGETRHAKWK